MRSFIACKVECHFLDAPLLVRLPSDISCMPEQIRFRRGLPPGDGVLFYPGEVFSSSRQPVASVRLERILSGLQVTTIMKLYLKSCLFSFANLW